MAPSANVSVSGHAQRVFEGTWEALEERHGWRISERRVKNPEILLTTLPFAWQDWDNRRAATFREQFGLEKVVAGAADDWEAVLLLRHWAVTQVPFGTPSFSTDDPTAIVHSALAGASYYCTHLAYTFVAAASSLGCPERLPAPAEMTAT